MVWYSLIYLVLLIIAEGSSKPSYTTRERYKQSLDNMNKNSSTHLICGVVTILFALVPIIDLFLPKKELGSDYLNDYSSAIFGCDYSNTGPVICVAFSVFFLIVGIAWLVKNLDYENKNKEVLENRIKDFEKQQEIKQQQALLAQQANDRARASLTTKYGEPERIFRLNGKTIESAFIVFPQSRSLYYNTRVIPYDQILGCEIKDESYDTVSGTKEEITKNSNGSTIGRALVGGLVAGPAGAIIGGVTSKKTTTVVDNTFTVTHHHYYVLINTSSTSTPVIRVDCDTDKKTAEEIKAIVSGIISKRSPSIPTGSSVADELAKLAVLKEQGILTQAEFDQQKQRLLNK